MSWKEKQTIVITEHNYNCTNSLLRILHYWPEVDPLRFKQVAALRDVT